MVIRNKILLEYFRELVGSISINELVENQALAAKIERTMAVLGAKAN